MNRIVFLISIVLVAVKAQASGWLTIDESARITSINIENNNIKISYTADDISDPDECGNQGYAIAQGETTEVDRMYSALLAAHMASKPIKIYSSGCFSGWNQTWPEISSLFIQ